MVPLIQYKEPGAVSNPVIATYLDTYLQYRKRQNPYWLRAALWILIAAIIYFSLQMQSFQP